MLLVQRLRLVNISTDPCGNLFFHLRFPSLESPKERADSLKLLEEHFDLVETCTGRRHSAAFYPGYLRFVYLKQRVR